MADEKQNVLIVHNYYQIPGGEDTVVSNEKRLLEEHGHKVILYCRDNKEIKDFSISQKLMLPFVSIFNGRTYRDIKRIIREEQIQIVHVHNTLHLISPSVYYAAVHCHVPVVQTVHNFRLLCPGGTFYRDGHICEDCVEKGMGCAVWHRCYRESRLQTLARVINMKIHRMTGIYGKISYICLTGFNKAKLLQQKQIRPRQVFIKPNFVDQIDKPIPLRQRSDRFIFVGRLDKLKGVDVLLQAWRLMKGNAPKLIICGTGPMEEWCKSYIKNNGLDMVEMKGLVPNEEIKILLADSKALILPTQWYEGFPMTMIEAFSLGTPVVGSMLGNVGRILKQYDRRSCFKSDSPEDICKKVKEIKVTPDDIYQYYLSRYTGEVNYRTLRKIYRKCSMK